MFARIIFTLIFSATILGSTTASEGAWDFLKSKKSKNKEQAEPENIKQNDNEPITGYTIKIPLCGNLEDFPLDEIDSLISDGTINNTIEKYFSQNISKWNEADYEMFQKVFNDCNAKVDKFFDYYVDETFHEDVADASSKLKAGRIVKKVARKTANRKVKTESNSQSPKKRKRALSKPQMRTGEIRMDCPSTIKWAVRILENNSAIAYEDHMRVISVIFIDEYFVPVFGKSFFTLSANDRNKLREFIGRCLRGSDRRLVISRTSLDSSIPVLLDPGNSKFGYYRAVKFATKSSKAYKYMKEKSAKLDALPLETGSLEIVYSIDTEKEKFLHGAWAHDRLVFSYKIIETRKRLMSYGLAEERKKMLSLGSGLAGLEAGATWYNHFHKIYGSNDDGETAAIMKEFYAIRKGGIASSRVMLEGLILKTTSVEQLNGLIDRYFVSTDWKIKEATDISSITAKRKTVLIQLAKRKERDKFYEFVAYLSPAHVNSNESGPKSNPFAISSESVDVSRLNTKPRSSASAPTTTITTYGRPSIGAELLSGAKSVTKALAQSRRDAAKISSFIARARRDYWECDGKCKDKYDKEMTFARALFGKDLHYADQTYITDSLSALDPSIRKTMGHWNTLTGDTRGGTGQVDGGILKQCNAGHRRWVSCLGGRRGEALQAAVLDCNKTYREYATCRDKEEWETRPFSSESLKDPMEHLIRYTGGYVSIGFPSIREQGDVMISTYIAKRGMLAVRNAAILIKRDPELKETCKGVFSCFRELIKGDKKYDDGKPITYAEHQRSVLAKYEAEQNKIPLEQRINKAIYNAKRFEESFKKYKKKWPSRNK